MDVRLFATVLLLATATAHAAQPAPLTLDQVVDKLIQRNQERSLALRSFEATRTYHLIYRGFPSDKEAEMTVDTVYESPSTKDFKVVSQSGCKMLLDRVFKKLLEGEQEAALPEMRGHTELNRSNYDFAWLGYEPSDQGGQYVLQVTPKSKNKFLYQGKIWVDAADFAVTRLEAEPAQNPSFWTRKNEIHHEYTKIQGFWLPVRNQSVGYTRFGGRAILTIEYKNYKLTGASDPTPTVSALVTGPVNSR